jgi:hypothetical protein
VNINTFDGCDVKANDYIVEESKKVLLLWSDFAADRPPVFSCEVVLETLFLPEVVLEY